MASALLILGFLFGAVIGSFLATIVVRWPEGRRVSTGRSQCDECGTQIGVRDLIPILSALRSRNRCRSCGALVDSAHLSIELTCAFIGAISFVLVPDPTGIALAVMGWLLVPLAWLDWRHLWLPGRLTAALAAGGIALGGYATGVALPDRLSGGILGYTMFWLVAAAYSRLRRQQGLGQGDVKLLGSLGLWVGWQAIPLVVLISALAGLVIALAQRPKHDRSSRIPYGAALAAAGYLISCGLARGVNSL